MHSVCIAHGHNGLCVDPRVGERFRGVFLVEARYNLTLYQQLYVTTTPPFVIPDVAQQYYKCQVATGRCFQGLGQGLAAQQQTIIQDLFHEDSSILMNIRRKTGLTRIIERFVESRGYDEFLKPPPPDFAAF